MKPIFLSLALLVLASCASTNQPKMPEMGEKPKGLLSMTSDKDVTGYADLRHVSTYQGNPNLRRFDMIRNYSKPSLFDEKRHLYISSSKAIMVINCKTNEVAILDNTYMSEYFAEGVVVAKPAMSAVGQWTPFVKNSPVGIIAETLCFIQPVHLKPEPAPDTRKPLINI